MTADERLALIRAKSEWANKHLSDLEVVMGTFRDSNPYKIAGKQDPETRKPVYYLIGVNPTPPDLSLRIGDVLQCTRSSLDHLAYQLVLVGNPGAVEPEKIVFPVGKDAHAFKSRLGGIKNGMRQSAVDAIKSVEPHGGGKGALLWTLHNLNNIDKHRAIFTTFVRQGGVDISGVPFGLDLPEWAAKAFASMPPIFIREINPLPAKVGDVLYIGAVDEPVDPKRKFAFEVAFAEPGVVEGKPILPTLHEMMDFVNGIVTAFWRDGHLA